MIPSICPLCQSQLRFLSAKDRECPTRMVNPKYIQPIDATHYKHTHQGVRIYLEEFRIIEDINLYFVFMLDANGSRWSKVMRLPVFEIKSEGQLTNKLKNLLVFI
jgi:hypothetical protein